MLKKLACVGLGVMLVIILSGCGKENKINNDTDVFNDNESKQEELKDDVNELDMYPTISLRPSNTVSKERMEFLYNSRLSELEGEFLTTEEYEAFTEDDKAFLNVCSILEPIGDEVYAQGIYKYEASSTYSDGKIDYSVKNLEDLFNGQSWVEGCDGFGIGEKIKVTMAPWSEHTITEREEIKTPEEACEVVVKYKEKGANDGTIKSYECIYNTLDNIYIINGYAKNDELWKANSRVKKMKLTIDNKEEYILELEDTNQLQVFDVHYKNDGISKPIVAEFEILEVYKGDKYEDTAMSFLYSYVSPNDIIWSAR